MELKHFEESQIPVIEVFNSISGEGISSGSIVTFVRVAGCNLRCSYCDTKYSYDESQNNSKLLKPKDILDLVNEYGCKDIICTGGEPLELNNAKRYLPLYLAQHGFRVRIETNGSTKLYADNEVKMFSQSNKLEIYYTLDAKCPTSGMHMHNIYEENYNKLKQGDELKFVVGSEDDIIYAYEIIDKYKHIFSKKNIIINFSPVFNKIHPSRLVEDIKERNRYFIDNGLKVRLSLQLHKYIWHPDAKGV
jgi:7-carboxy-7-deazaguanine synthase